MPIQSFHELTDFLREKARQGYLALKHHRPGETLCAFALDTDDDTVAFGAWGITEEQFALLLADRNRKNPPNSSFERRCRESYLRMNPQEWPEIEYGEVPFRAESADVGQWPTATMAFMSTWTSIQGNTFRAFRSHAFRAMADALHSLDCDGLFGRGRERDAIVLFLSISDSEDDGLLQMASSRLLNPPHVYRKLVRSIPLRMRGIFFGLSCWRRIRNGPIIARKQ